MIWYLEDLLRYRAERQRLEVLAAAKSWLQPIGWRLDYKLRVVWDTDICVGDRRYPVSLQYPNHFPHSPPLVLPRGETARWSSHQWGAGGELCLEYGADNWEPSLTGAEMIASAHRLLTAEQSGSAAAAVPSRHSTTTGQDLRGSFSRFFITGKCAAFLETLRAGESCPASVLSLFHDEAFISTVYSASRDGSEKWVDPSVPAPLRIEGFLQDAVAMRWQEGDAMPNTEELEAFNLCLTDHGFHPPTVSYVIIAIGKSVHVYRTAASDSSVTEMAVVCAGPDAGRLGGAHALLAQKKIGLVGCGSVGSKIATTLARSGVGRFLLVDDDVLLPENLVRHDLDWRDIATHKAESVSRRLQLVNPSAHCEVRRHRLGGQESSGAVESLIGSLAQCDLIVDATAEARVFNFLCAAAASGQKPMLWAEVFGGGIGGLVARHRPGSEPTPALMRRAIENWCAERGSPLPQAPRRYEIDREGQPPLIASDADVSVIAAHAARLAIDTLTDGQLSPHPYSAYMIGLANSWIFTQSHEVHPIVFSKPEPTCDAPGGDEAEKEKELEHIGAMFRKHVNETSNPGTDIETT